MPTSRPPSGVDVGVLYSKREGGHEEGGGELRKTGRHDVYQALHAALYRGCCFAFDRADGVAPHAPALPTTLGLRIAGAGDVSLPLRESDVEAIKNKASEVNDGSCRRVYELGPKKVKIQNPSWTTALGKLVETVAYKLGVNPVFLTAELDALLYMEKGSSSVGGHFNENAGAGILGTLLIQLPSKFTGGEVSFRDEDSNGEEAIHAFDLGAGLHSQFACHYVCFYSGVEFEFARLRSGNRVFLRYSLIHRGQSVPTATMVRSSMSPLRQALRMLPPVDRIVMVPLANEYEAANLSHGGINALSSYHRGMFEALKAAAGADWKMLIVNAEMNCIHFSGERLHDIPSKDSSISQIFDECGNDVSNTLKWLGAVANFDPHFDGEGNSMILSDPRLSDPYILVDPDETIRIGKHWGPCKERSSTYTNDAYNYHYSDERQTKKVYRATFLLTYCTSCETLVRCLGGTEGVAEMSQKVVAARDYDLLRSVLSVVETKEKSKFNVSSCTMLLQMLTRSTSRDAKSEIRSALANRVLLGLSTLPTGKPSDELYDAILSFVDKLGHEHLSKSITKLISGNSCEDFPTFLQRTNFILKLNGRIERRVSLQKSASTGCSVDHLVGICSSSLAQYGEGYIADSPEAIRMIYSMVDQHGWEKMERIVDASLSWLNSSRSTCFGDLTVRTILFRMLDKNGRVSTCQLKDYSSDLIRGLKRIGHEVISLIFSGEQKQLLVRGIYWSLQHGDIKACSDLGSWARDSRENLHVLLTIIAELPFARLAALVLLKRSLVHHSVSQLHYRGWSDDKMEDGTVSPSIHIREVLDKYPGLALTTDSRGRIPLHHAAASASSSVEVIMEIFEANPKGASVQDPLTGLYPFMIAAAAGKVSASFSLLLADPNLICGGSQDSITKKRKRTNLDDVSAVNNLVREGGNNNRDFGDEHHHSMLPPPLDGEYDIKIPFTPFGLLLNVGDVKNSVVFCGYRKKPDGSKGPAELGKMIRRFGDIIIAINGRSVVGTTFREAICLLRSKGSYAYLRMAHRTRVTDPCEVDNELPHLYDG